MTHPVTKFAKDVAAGKVVAGKLQRLSCQRHLEDLKTGKARGLFFDKDHADEAMAFFPETLVLSAGKFEGIPFSLLPWQQFCVGSVYGWKQADGRRRFSKAYVETGKGSGKTPLAAGMCLRSICADGEARAEGYIIARTAEQALVTFRAAAAMVEQSPALSGRLSVSGGQHPYNIAHAASMSFMRRVSSDKHGKGKSGPLPHFLVVDEYHEHDSSAMLEFYDAGTKNRTEPLTLIITNSGAGMETPCGLEHSYAISVLNGATLDDDYFAFITALDDEDDPFESDGCWIKSNPSMPTLPSVEYLTRQVSKARGFPSKRALVERLNFCRWTDAESPWLDRALWVACEREPTAEIIEARQTAPAYMAIDLSLKTDLSAGAVIWDLGEGGFSAELRIWTPADTLEDRATSDNAPYPQWADEGHLVAVPGRVLDYSVIAEWIAAVVAEYDVAGLAFDPWKMDLLEAALDRVGITTTRDQDDRGALLIIPHPQGFVAGAKAVSEGRGLYMPRSIDDTEAAILKGELQIAPNPVVRSAALGTVVVEDASSNRRFNKLKSTTRIDAMVSLTMGVGFASAWRSGDELDDVNSVILADLY